MPSPIVRSASLAACLLGAAWAPAHAQELAEDAAPPPAREPEPATQHAAHPWFESLWAEHHPAWERLPQQTTEETDAVREAAHATATGGLGPWPGVADVPGRVSMDLGDASGRVGVLARPRRAWGLLRDGMEGAHDGSVDAARGGAERAVGLLLGGRATAADAARDWTAEREERLADLDADDEGAGASLHAALQGARNRREARALDAASLVALAWPRPVMEARGAHQRLGRAAWPAARTLALGAWRDGTTALSGAPGMVAGGTRATTERAFSELGDGTTRARAHGAQAAEEFRRARDEGVDLAREERTQRALSVAAWRDNMDASRKTGALQLRRDVRGAQDTTSERLARAVNAAWSWGWEGHARGGAQLAGDNAFAGDGEGALLAGWYGTGSVVAGAGTVGGLVPMAVGLHGSMGTAWMAGLGTRAAVGGVALGLADVGGTVGTWLDGTRREAWAWNQALLGMGAALGEGAVHGAWDVGSAGVYAAWATAVGTATTTRELLTRSALPVATAHVQVLGALLFPVLGLPAAHASVALATLVRTVTPLVGAGVVLALAGTAWTVDSAAANTGHAVGWARRHVGATAGMAILRVALGMHGALSMGAAAAGAWTWVMVVVPWVVAFTWASAVAGVVRDLVVRPWSAAFSLPVILLGGAFSTWVVLTAAGMQLAGGVAAVWTHTLVDGVHHGTATALAGAARSVDVATAPFQLDRLLAWRAERTPQVEAMLARQPEDVRRRVGTRVEYVRVMAAGPDRGKVEFMDVQNDDGVTTRLYRTVRGNGAVEFVDGAGKVRVDSGWVVDAAVEVP